MTPEQLAKSREEFEQLLLATNEWCLASFQSNGDKYYDWKLQAMFDGFLLRQESLVVELPKTQEHKKKDQLAITNMKSGFNVCIGEIKHSLQSAGINYREKE